MAGHYVTLLDLRHHQSRLDPDSPQPHQAILNQDRLSRLDQPTKRFSGRQGDEFGGRRRMLIHQSHLLTTLEGNSLRWQLTQADPRTLQILQDTNRLAGAARPAAYPA